ncbi:hypothetical protein [Streptomyces viridochromogenes]|uniref:hypothetical protein n=1 Tax=Streptomyces viridochromogenes TaxID=1938 RepID=UPI001331A621|nr:hypothetical protein [Streptomyces viridochromogenes]
MVGLIVSAVATYYTGLALRDQQIINRDQNEREHRSQAMQVGFWYTNSQPNNGDVAVVSNRSPDAVYQLTVRFSFLKWPSGPIPTEKARLKLHKVVAEYTSASLPPCTQLVFTKKILHASFDRLEKEEDVDVEQPISTALIFEDAQGAKWARGTTLRELSSLEGFGMEVKNLGQRIQSGKLVPEVPNGNVAKTRPEPNCGKF